MTFFIVLIFFVLQFFYIYIDDFVGKGLAWYIVLELILYLSANVVPIALPLAVLLSAIMSFGNLGERYELTALKASGISLARFMASAVVSVVLLSVGSLAFSNYVMPSANLKFYTTLIDITQSKPALDIPVGIFYTEIDNYVIKIDRKGQDGNKIYGVYVADQSNRRANDDIMVADSGIMFTSADKRFLIFRLFHGKKYEILKPERRSDNQHQQTITTFEQMEKVLDLSEFQLTRSNEERFRDHYIMMNMAQLNSFIDSVRMESSRLNRSVQEVLQPYFYFYRDSSRAMLPPDKSVLPAYGADTTDITQLLPEDRRQAAVNRTVAYVKSIKDRLEAPIGMRLESFERYIVRAQIEWHRKYMLAFSCLVLLFVGAPFGTIVRKGGFGYPVLFAIIFYVIYYILFKVGEDMARKAVVTPFVGMWMASIIMLPVALFFTWKAINDSSILLLENYETVVKRWRGKLKKRFG